MKSINDLNQLKADATRLHSKSVIDSAIDKIAKNLTAEYQDKNPFFLVVMNGGLIFAGHLLSRIHFPCEIGYCHATRYRGKTSASEIEWKAKPPTAIADRHVILVDDILDEGYTLRAIIDECKSLQALSVKTAILVEKIHYRKAIENMKPDFCELQTPDAYVFGFGMDVEHYWRNTDAIYILNSEK